jgi:DnaK suppressor protein
MDELTSDQKQELQADLLVLQTELEKLLTDSQESAKPVELNQPIGRLSRMDALQQQAMAKANRAGTEKRLKLIEAALLAIRQQRYGECRRCEEPIGYRRLKARPESPLCLDCQGKLEEG